MITARPRSEAHHPSGRDRMPASSRERTSALAVGAGVTVVAVVSAVDPGGLAPFGPLKWAVATTGVLALVAACVAARRPLRVARLPTALFAAFVGWAAVAAAVGVDPLYAWIGTPERHAGVLAWALCAAAFAVGQALRARERPAVAWAASLAAGVAGAWALAEVLGREPVRLTGVTGRPGGPFGSSAYLGAATALLAPVAWGVALDRSIRYRLRRAAAAGAALATVALVASGARAAWAGALVAVGVVLLARRRRSHLRPRHPVRAAAAVLVGLAIVVGIAAATGVVDRVPGLVQDDRGGARGRLDEWRVAVRVVADHPLAGVGPEGYRIAFADAVDARYEQRHGREPLPDRAHSSVLDVAATTGLPGAALYLLLLGVVAAGALRALRRREAWVVGTTCGVFAYFAQSLVLFPVPELDVVAWLLAGAVVAPVAPARARDDTPANARRRPVVAVAMATAAALAALAGGLDVAADRAAARTLADSTDANAAARLRPDVVRYHLVAARAHEAEGTLTGLDAALARVRRAARLSPQDPIVRQELARLLLERARRTRSPGDVDAARAVLEALARRDRNHAETRLRLGLARALDGDQAGAVQAWAVAERLAPRSAAASTNLAVAHAQAGRLEDARRAARRALSRNPAATRARDILRTIEGRDGT